MAKAFLQRHHTEVCGQAVRDPPGQHPPGIPVQNGDQVDEALGPWPLAIGT